MADLNIRNVDPKLIAELKSEAALLGTNLKSYVMAILAGGVRYRKGETLVATMDHGKSWHPSSLGIDAGIERAPRHGDSRKPLLRTAHGGCVYCGGLNGVHQKNCTKDH